VALPRAGGEEAVVRVDGPIRTDNGDAMLPALRRGWASRGCPNFLVARGSRGGRLEAVLDDWSAGPSGLHLLTPPGTLRPARVEALIEFLSDFKRVCTKTRSDSETPESAIR
jgi:DNA-binding transcriptional LysR family regulator